MENRNKRRKMMNQNENNDVNVPLIKKKRDINITNNMSKVTKDIANQLAEEIERQPHSHTNYGYWSQSSLDPGATMVSKTEAKKQKIPIVNNGSSDEIINGNPKDKQLWRDLIAYWILGLCNNYGYVVMLSAAHDIIDKFNHSENVNVSSSEPTITDFGRVCHVVSTGTILLADIIPSMIAKISAPFLPFWVHCRVFVSVALAAAGFLLVAFATSEWMAILGVICTSFSCGLGETTFLAYSTHFEKNVVSTWSSGTGGAGVIGSLSYAALTSLNIGPANTMLIMLIFPAIEAAAFWILLRRPSINKNVDKLSESSSSDEIVDDEKPLITIREKIYYTFSLMKYMLPLTLVYFFEYFINQGLFELVYFENTFLDKAAQYRWLNFDYQVGVFISRSSVNCFTLNKIYLMSIFQFVNVVYFVIEVMFYITPNLWIVFIIVFWEGLLGGGAYVNTFYRMSKEISQARRVFAMGIVAQADSYGIALSGFLAIPVHNAICRLPAPHRLYTF